MTPSETSPPRSLRCERCGATFECFNGRPGCWCEHVTLTREKRAALAGSFDDCLCDTCLRETPTPQPHRAQLS